jgi:excisionase family DNA binding protein
MNQLLNVEDAARLLAISPWTIRAYLKEGKLFPVRIGRRVLLEESELQRFIAESRTRVPSSAPELFSGANSR